MKNIVVNKDGMRRIANNVSRIVTKDMAGTATSWMPEDETSLGEIRIIQNGEYAPMSEGFFGYYKVNVLVPGGDSAYVERDWTGGTTIEWVTPEPSGAGEPIGGSVVGTASDGNQYYVYVDSEGYVHKTKIPSVARVEVKPRKLIYADGDLMGYQGMVIGLFYGDGKRATEWDGGRISYGTVNWQEHVSEFRDAIRFDGNTTEIDTYVLPFWVENGVQLGETYGLKVTLSVTRGGYDYLVDHLGNRIVTWLNDRVIVIGE